MQNYGVDLGVEMCKRLLDAGAPGLHMYTLNLEKSAVAILSRLGLIDSQRAPRWACTKRLGLTAQSHLWCRRVAAMVA